MDAQRIAVATACLNGAYDGSMTFPEIVATLAASSFESYLVDFRGHTTTYCLSDGATAVLTTPRMDASVAPAFDAAGVAAQVRWARGNPPDYSYPAFCRNVMAAGCAGYMVSILGRRAVYLGRTAETHVELFPQ